MHLRRNVGFWTLVPTVITPYSTVQITVGQIYGVRPYKTVPPYGTNLLIWLFGTNFGPKHFFSFQLLWISISTRNRVLRPTFEFPCKPLLGRFPKLMQPQSSLRVVQGSIVWRQHVRGACSRWKWEVLGCRGLSETSFALAVPAWHHTVHRTVDYRNYGKLRSSQIDIQNYGTYSKKRTVPYTVQCTGLVLLHLRNNPHHK